MIKGTVTEHGNFIISGDEPFRLEIGHAQDSHLDRHGVIVDVYTSSEIDPNQEPIGGFDSVHMSADENKSWVYPPHSEVGDNQEA